MIDPPPHAPNPAADPPVVVRFENVTKTYSIVRRATPRVGAWVVSKLLEYYQREPFHALSDVSFEVRAGEMLGLVGANGAGKSTVLKLTSGITQPTRGTVRVRGRIASLLELGVGFHPDLTGLENIFYNAAIMGLARAEVLERLDAIIDFSGLRPFLFEPVRHYSSGMYARLACSVALHTDPDVVLSDEILAVGDAEFQRRGMEKLLELHDAGTTIVLVSHHISMVRDLCTRLLWIDHGRIRAEGDPRAVVHDYLHEMSHHMVLPGHFLSPSQVVVAGADDAALDSHGLSQWRGASVPRLAGVRLLDGDGAEAGELSIGQPVVVEVAIDPARAATPCRVALCLRWSDGRSLFEDTSEPFLPADSPVVRYRIDAWPFLRARMKLSVALLDADRTDIVLDRRIDALQFSCTSPACIPVDEVVMHLPADWTVTPAPK